MSLQRWVTGLKLFEGTQRVGLLPGQTWRMWMLERQATDALLLQ